MPSSTSSSENAQATALLAFGRHLLWLTPLLVLGMVAFNVVTVRLGNSALPQLANIPFQLARLDAAEAVDTLFLGDSSLGRQMDMATWEALSGETGLALPLTGGEGYMGDLYMLQEVLKRHRPSRVVLVHAADVQTRNIAWRAYSILRPDMAPGSAPRFVQLLPRQLKDHLSKKLLMASLKGIAYRLLDRPLPFLADGYVKPRPALVPRRDFDPTAPMTRQVDDIDPEKLRFLDLVIALCAREWLDCRYAIGPLWDAICTRSRDYLEAASAAIEARGMPVVGGTPICVPLADLDDTVDHVAWVKRSHYTVELHRRLVADQRADQRAGEQR